MFDIFDTIIEDNPKEKKPKAVIKHTKNDDEKLKVIETNSEDNNSLTEENIINNETEDDNELNNTEDTNEQEDEEQIEEKELNKKRGKTEDVALTFLENPETGHAIIGRQKSVFKKYGEEGTLYLGKVNEPNYPEKDIYFDSLNPQVVFICGSRGSGKSYMLGVLAEELAIKNKNVGQIVIDPIGVFWSMRYPNKEKREMELLENFGLNPMGLENIMVFVPEGAAEKIPKETYDSTFTIQPSFLSSEDWALTFSIDRFSPSGLLLEKVIKKVKDGYRTLKGLIFKAKDENYDLNDIIFCLENDAELNSKEKGYRKESIRALVSRFEAAKTWGIFSKRGTPLIELSVPGQLTIIDTSFLEENVSALLVGILARRILNARKMNSRKEATKQMGSNLKIDLENDIPPTWLFLDEAHTLIPSGSLATPASKAIVEYVKQGRKPGCSLVIATQQPSAIDTRVLSQVGTLATYKLIFDDDIKAVFRRMPSIVPKDYKEPDFIKKLGIGIPIFADRVETTSRAFVLNVRPRMSQHEGREIQTIETSHNLTEEEALDVMVNVTKSKLKQFEELDEHSLKTLLKIMNMKFKKDVKYKEYIAKLLDNEIVEDKGKYFIPKDEEDSEYFEEKVTYNVLDSQYSQEEITGSAKRATGWQNFNVNQVYRPIFKVNYKVHNSDGSFAENTCYIDAVKVEFVHYIDDDFVYSEGLSILRTLEADDIRILLALPKKSGFDNEYLKDAFPYGDVKLKNTMDRFISMGILRKEKRSTKNVFFLIKNLELPKNPIHKVLSTFEDLDLIQEPVDKENILDARATFETVRNVLGTLWETIKIDEIETVLKQEFLITNLDTKETVLFDAFTGKKIV
jgi:hypothetical protein